MVLKALKREMSYYPTCFDDSSNKSEKVGDKIKVNFKSYPSGLQLSKYKSFTQRGAEISIKYDYANIILNHVESIENLSIENDKIETPVQLCDYEDVRLYDLMVDIKNKLFDDSEVLTQGEN